MPDFNVIKSWMYCGDPACLLIAAVIITVKERVREKYAGCVM